MLSITRQEARPVVYSLMRLRAMPKQVISITNQEHADTVASVGGQNGLNITSVGVYNGGELVAYDEVRMEVDGMRLKVRSVPENELVDVYRNRIIRYLEQGFPGITEEEETDKE